MTCTHTVDSGVYVLGALSPTARAAFERHMAGCTECRAEVNEFAVLPALLGRVEEPTVVAQAAEAPASVLPGVLARVHRRRRLQRMIAFAAAAAIACLGLVAGLAMPAGGPAARHIPSAAGPSVVASPSRSVMRPVADVEVPVSASVALTPFSGGTRINVQCTYPKLGAAEYGYRRAQFSLWVIPRNGAAPEQVGTWTAGPGDDVVVPAMTWLPISQVQRIEMRTPDGKPALTYDVA